MCEWLANANNSNNLNNINNDGNNNNNNNNCFGVRPVASINCGYAIINCIRDNIETRHIQQLSINLFNYKIKIDKYSCQ